jgi:indoleamine 2,3-dioxygenase
VALSRRNQNSKRAGCPASAAKILDQHAIHSERGFLPDPDPLDRLPDAFSAWEAMGRELPKLLITGKVRSVIQELPVLDAKKLRDDGQRRRAMVLLSFLGHAYAWGEKEATCSIPKCLALPWYQLSQILGRPPVLSYSSYALDNWKRLDPKGPIELGNIFLSQNFLGGQDEEWFVLIHVAIEAKAAPALVAALSGQQAVAGDVPELLEQQLEVIAETLEVMHQILLRMPDRCDPYIYYHRVRPYLHGWANHPSLPSGMVYEGVDNYGGRPQTFRGETGAQSSIIPSLDAALGIRHGEDLLLRYLKEMRDYMPPNHRAFIAAVEAGPSVRDYVLRHGNGRSSRRDAYNAAVAGIERFRSTHLEYAHAFIVKQSQVGSHNPVDVGTGGTPFAAYLEKHRNETAQHLIK